jgi:NADH dehydrogenase
LGHNVLATLDGEPLRAFQFGMLGQLASLGRGSAVAEMYGLQCSGWFAWWLWRAVYLAKLPGLERRLRVLADWVHGAFLPRDTVRIQLERSGAVTRLHYLPGQTVVRQGNTGARFYIVLAGRVAVVHEGPDGEVALAELGRGEHFGELALLQSGQRTATVRAITPVDLLSIERNDFLALLTTGAFYCDLEPAMSAPGAIGVDDGLGAASAAR